MDRKFFNKSIKKILLFSFVLPTFVGPTLKFYANEPIADSTQKNQVSSATSVEDAAPVSADLQKFKNIVSQQEKEKAYREFYDEVKKLKEFASAEYDQEMQVKHPKNSFKYKNLEEFMMAKYHKMCNCSPEKCVHRAVYERLRRVYKFTENDMTEIKKKKEELDKRFAQVPLQVDEIVKESFVQEFATNLRQAEPYMENFLRQPEISFRKDLEGAIKHTKDSATLEKLQSVLDSPQKFEQIVNSMVSQYKYYFSDPQGCARQVAEQQMAYDKSRSYSEYSKKVDISHEMDLNFENLLALKAEYEKLAVRLYNPFDKKLPETYPEMFSAHLDEKTGKTVTELCLASKNEKKTAVETHSENSKEIPLQQDKG